MTNLIRPIRSFVLRQGRVSQAQQRAYTQWLPVYGIPYQAQRLDYKQTFGRSAPTVLEIGFGMGESTVHIAALMPDTNFIGVEVHTPGVGSLLKHIAERDLNNLRLIQHDAVEVLEHMIGENSLAGVHIFFPDPWPKKRHHKRRLIQPDFVHLLVTRLQAGGYIHAATDWEQYAAHMLATLSQAPQLENTAADYAPRPAYRPLTKFEQRGIKLGHGVWDIVFRKRALP